MMSGKYQYANPELAGIVQDVVAGKYAALEQQLFIFLQKNLSVIEREKTSWEQRLKTAVTPTFAAKQVIIRCKSVDVKTEIGSQYEEIRREAWYRGDTDHNRVATAWAKQHAGGWRDHYTLTLVMILDSREQEFLDLYNKEAQDK